jgi:hypothetical protein
MRFPTPFSRGASPSRRAAEPVAGQRGAPIVSIEKITASHRARQAIIYVRQSTLEQVATNLESQRRQYGLAERAVDLGWPRTDVVVIDDDLGVSGGGTWVGNCPGLRNQRPICRVVRATTMTCCQRGIHSYCPAEHHVSSACWPGVIIFLALPIEVRMDLAAPRSRRTARPLILAAQPAAPAEPSTGTSTPCWDSPARCSRCRGAHSCPRC